MNRIIPSTIGKTPHYYAKEGLIEGVVQPWEDGWRTQNLNDAFEWWYFDAHLDDGSTVVIGFYSKSAFDARGPLSPYASFTMDTPQGVHINSVVRCSEEDFGASTRSCDVAIGACSFAGDLHHYTIHFDSDDVMADVSLVGTVPSWRANTGFAYYGEHDEQFFAWLAAVPQGTVKATITVAGETQEYAGYGYHDHNWGNAPMMQLMHHWYWARAKVGDYTILSTYIVTAKPYGYRTNLKFMLAKNGEILADNTDDKVTFSSSDQVIDEKSGKPIDRTTIYRYEDVEKCFEVTYAVNDIIIDVKMADTLPSDKRELAEKAGFDGAYLRFRGDVTVKEFKDGTVIDAATDPGLWELMYFGHPLIDGQEETNN